MFSYLGPVLSDLNESFYNMGLDQRTNIQGMISYLGDVFEISMDDILAFAAEADFIRLLKHLPIVNSMYNAQRSRHS